MSVAIEPQTHAVRAYLLWDDHGLSPYWGFVSAYEPDQDDRELSFETLGTEWVVENCSHWEGGLAAPASADFEGGLYEYKIQLEDAHSIDRDVGLTVRAGYPNATHHETGQSIGGMPDDCPESVRIEVTATNVGLEDLQTVLQEYFAAIGVNPEYIAGEPHEYSRITRLERYVRIRREPFESSIVAEGGVIDRLSRFGNRDGLRGEHSWDHEEIVGHHEAVRLGAATWRMLLDRDDLDLGFGVKGYHPDQPRSESVDPEEDPLAAPKVEAAYKKAWSGETIAWDERDRAIEETRTVLWNVLDWAGVEIDAETGPWIRDDYFDARGVDEPGDGEIVLSPLDDLEDSRREAVVDQLAATSLSDQQRRVLIALFDSESNHYRALADRAEVGTSTIYRLLDSLSGLLESMRGQIRFADEIVRDRVGGVVDRLQEVSSWGRDRVQEAADRASAIVDGAIQKWVRRHGIEILEDSPQLEIDLGEGLTRDEAREILRAGLGPVSESTGLEADDLFGALVYYRDRDGVEWRCRARDPRRGWLVPLLNRA